MRRIQRGSKQLRARPLIVDPTTTVDLAAYDPPIETRGAGGMLLLQLNADTPYWLDGADLPMVAMLAAATDAVADALKDKDASPASRAAIIKEWRSLASELGLSPTSRSRLRLTEAQAVTAARRAEALAEKRNPAMDLDDLLNE